MRPQRGLPHVVQVARQATGFGEYFKADGLGRFDPTGAFAIFANGAERAFKRLFDTLAGHDDQSEVVEGKYLRRRLVAGQSLLQRLRDLMAVAAVFHIDQIEHDDAPKIAEPDLPCDLIDRL